MDNDFWRQFDKIVRALRKNLKRKRFFHSLGAMHTAVALADRHGVDVGKAAAAGLLHDCGRLQSTEMVETETRRLGLEVPEEDQPYVGIWHAYLSAHIAEHEFGVADREVLRAIRLHPTGEADMSPLDRIIFMSDYIEPTRHFPGLNELRELAEGDLDKGFKAILEQKLLYIQAKGRPLHPRAVRALAAVGGQIREVESSFRPERRHDELPASKTK